MRFYREGETAPRSGEDPAALLMDCRLLRKDELQVVRRGGGQGSPDCVLRSPRRVGLTEPGTLVTCSVDDEGELFVQLLFDLYQFISIHMMNNIFHFFRA